MAIRKERQDKGADGSKVVKGTEKSKRRRKRGLKRGEWIAMLAILVVVAALVIYSFWERAQESKEWLVYPDCLDMTAVIVNSNPLTLRDMAFYIAYDEQTVEEQALLYDEEDSTRYWNLFINHDGFVRETAKNATMQKAIHDEIFYRMAQKENVVLTAEDEPKLQEVKSMFWNSILYGDKQERMGVTKEDLDGTIEKVAIAQKYQGLYAKEKNVPFADYDSTGDAYHAMLEENKVEIQEEVWDKVHYGDVSLAHENGIFQNRDKGE